MTQNKLDFQWQDFIYSHNTHTLPFAVTRSPAGKVNFRIYLNMEGASDEVGGVREILYYSRHHMILIEPDFQCSDTKDI